MSRILKAALALACGAATSLAFTGGPAAASATSASASVPGASGSITGLTWPSQNEAHFRLKVKDTAADGIHAEVRVTVWQMNGDTVAFPIHKAVGKGHVYDNAKAHVFDAHPIGQIRIIVCATGVSKGHHVSWCKPSAWIDRPV